MASDYDGFQLRVSFKISQSEFSVKIDSGESQSIPRSALPFLPIRLDRIDPQRLALSANADANLLIGQYPQQVQSTIRLILGIQALAESRLPAALAWLEPRIYRWETDRPHDESLRAALRAVALQRTHDGFSAVTEIGYSVTAFNRRLDRTDDLVATGDLAKRLPRLLAVAHNYVTSPRLVAALQRADGHEIQSAKQLSEIFNQAYGQQWIPLMRFGEAYQFYVYDESFRALPSDERAVFEKEIAELVEGMQRRDLLQMPLHHLALVAAVASKGRSSPATSVECAAAANTPAAIVTLVLSKRRAWLALLQDSEDSIRSTTVRLICATSRPTVSRRAAGRSWNSRFQRRECRAWSITIGCRICRSEWCCRSK